MAVSSIAIIGSGRVAGALARSFHRAGLRISAVISRNEKTAADLALTVGSISGSEYRIPPGTSIVIIAVPDSAIGHVASGLKTDGDTVVVHTSGSTGIDVFPDGIPGYGVIYPLQTFTEGRELDMKQIHYFTEASSKDVHSLIDEVTRLLGPHIHHIDSESRRVLHLSAVFVSNFVNHMLYAGMSIAGEHDIDRMVFGPLIRETVQKAIEIGPVAAQTGPAIRNDISTIEKHLLMLSFSDDLSNLYRVISDSIIKQGTESYNV
ncbi:MAG: DUF2520 domain-containing protein [Bacteroidetes bacterium]|nr:DUF2520 domain-containing protein [Bacteroidota bacterium]